jgi:8-oxo-dGTP pyrophosphatase MutT (NUDIX family)
VRGRDLNSAPADPTPEDVRAAEAALGPPATAAFVAALSDDEWRDLERRLAPGRRHDAVFVLVAASGRLAAMRKPEYPVGAWRIPGGGVEPGESLVEGARRELYEETGLRAVPTRYVLRATVDFRSPGAVRRWTTHVLAGTCGDEPEFSVVDAGEAVAERAFVTPAELRAAGTLFRSTGLGALSYRADVQDLILSLLEAPRPAPLR